MKNVEMKVDEKKKTLTIVVDLSKEYGLSKSQKSQTIASTEGNATVPGTDIKIGLNVYKKATAGG